MRIEDRLRDGLGRRAAEVHQSVDAWARLERRLHRSRRRAAGSRLVAAVVALGAAAATITWLWVAFRPGGASRPAEEPPEPLEPRVTAEIPVGAFPAGIAAGEGSVWVAVPGEDCRGEVVRIDPATNEVAARIPVAAWPADLAVGFGSVWIEGLLCAESPGGQEGGVIRVDPLTNTVTAAVPLGKTSADVAVGEGAVWVTVSDASQDSGEVVRVDPATSTVVARVPVEGDPRDVVVGEGGVWVLSRAAGEIPHLCPAEDSCLDGGSRSLSGLEVLHIDPRTNEVVAAFPDALSVGVGEDALWMSVWLTEADPGLVRVDPATGRRLGEGLTGDFRGFAGEHGTMGTLVVGDGGVWLWGFPNPHAEEGRIYRLNATTFEIDASVAPEGNWIDAVLDPSGDTLWLSNYEDSVTRIDLR